jgi:hypothetical protein
VALARLSEPVIAPGVPIVRLLPCTVSVPVKLAAEEIVWPLIRPEVMVPRVALPELSILVTLLVWSEPPVLLMLPEPVMLVPPLMAPLRVREPMLTRLPLLSIRWVPAPAPVLMPVVPFRVVPVMVLVVAIVPNPVVMEPAPRAPTPVMEEKVPACRLELVILPFTMAEPLYCNTSPLARELRVRVVPCSLAMVGLG